MVSHCRKVERGRHNGTRWELARQLRCGARFWRRQGRWLNRREHMAKLTKKCDEECQKRWGHSGAHRARVTRSIEALGHLAVMRRHSFRGSPSKASTGAQVSWTASTVKPAVFTVERLRRTAVQTVRRLQAAARPRRIVRSAHPVT